MLGPCLFAVSMGVSRALYGKYGGKLDLTKTMLASGALCLACYLLAAASSGAVPGLIGCILCGFSVGIMWPGTLSISSKSMPLGGTAMFALLAMAGDLGGASAPGLVGWAAQRAGDNLRAGFLAGGVFPVLLIAGLIAMRRLAGGKRDSAR